MTVSKRSLAADFVAKSSGNSVLFGNNVMLLIDLIFICSLDLVILPCFLGIEIFFMENVHIWF